MWLCCWFIVVKLYSFSSHITAWCLILWMLRKCHTRLRVACGKLRCLCAVCLCPMTTRHKCCSATHACRLVIYAKAIKCITTTIAVIRCSAHSLLIRRCWRSVFCNCSLNSFSHNRLASVGFNRWIHQFNWSIT